MKNCSQQLCKAGIVFIEIVLMFFKSIHIFFVCVNYSTACYQLPQAPWPTHVIFLSLSLSAPYLATLQLAVSKFLLILLPLNTTFTGNKLNTAKSYFDITDC